ncbi:putative membrane protein [Rhodopirellula islandica]|uniref:Membrane protein n=1 Tax=Rhodopirellula islandica TaxID=595434 RepID=A0A0J1B708_RHOIS|nr:DUF2306 domain-containing protein [Rhodopirellula islandica]KLU02595.1 putative membrane protein [Rhodopirellula islandica]
MASEHSLFKASPRGTVFNRDASRLNRLVRVATAMTLVLGVSVLVQLLLPYQDYFPANLKDSVFLSAHRSHFHGWYSIAFYVHIVAGPIALVQGAALFFSGSKRKPTPRWHRVIGRVQAVVVLLFLFPSGLVMAQHAMAGPSAEVAFTLLSLATAITMALAIRSAMSGRIRQHRLWATRCFLLLCSPLMLRVVVGFTILTGTETDFAHRLLAWASWLVPWFLFEVGRKCHDAASMSRNTTRTTPATASIPISV